MTLTSQVVVLLTRELYSRQIFGVELTGEEYDEYNRVAGELALEQLSKLISGEMDGARDYVRFSDGPDGKKAFAIRKVLSATREVARAEMLENPKFRDLRSRAEDKITERAKRLTTPAQGIRLP